MNGLDLAVSALVVTLAGIVVHLLIKRCYWTGFVSPAILVVNSVLMGVAGWFGLKGPLASQILPLGLPWLPFHLQLDALGGFFLLTIALLSLAVAIYSFGYARSPGNKGVQEDFFLPLFVVGMEGVVLADDAFVFMIFWELMSIASYFLVTVDHHKPENRYAGFLYLIMAHTAGICILSAFAVLYAAGGEFTFSVMRDAPLTPIQGSATFLLAFIGFGMKAGSIPLHVWLPVAHPAAPANASALMSGVMIKVALFGFLRLVWDIMGAADFAWWWGSMVLASGSLSAVGGVLLAIQQHDMKRLLAYHSVENIGIILIGLGLGMIFVQQGHPLLAALGLIAALYHTLNHALFKGLLFMGAGAVIHATGTGNMDRLGGLIHRMPVTALFFLVGCVAISALPPLNGFVSEWLTFQAAILSPHMEGVVLPTMVPLAASMLAMAGALAAACFVKVFGVVFLGAARLETVAQAKEVNGAMLGGMALPALLCLLLGIFPGQVVNILGSVSQQLLPAMPSQQNFLLLTPVSLEQSSYAAPVLFLGLLGLVAALLFILHFSHQARRRSLLWSCGHPAINPRMQYSATSFSQPLRLIFADLYRPQIHIDTQYHGHESMIYRVHHKVHVDDPSWRIFYLPIRNAIQWAVHWIARFHEGRIHTQIGYLFVTLLILMGLFG